MKVIIEVPDFIYKAITERDYLDCPTVNLNKAIIEGTVLPEEHGDLIDRDKLKFEMPTPIEDEYKTAYRIIDSMPAVIEADMRGDNNG